MHVRYLCNAKKQFTLLQNLHVQALRSLDRGHARIQPLHHGAERVILCQIAAECPRVRCWRLPVVPICLSIVFRLPLQALAVQRHAAILKPKMTQSKVITIGESRTLYEALLS